MGGSILEIKRLWLIEARKNKNISRFDLAKSTGVNHTYIEKIENGKRRPSPEVAQKIAVVLGFDWTLFFEDKKSKSA